jgi:hypothetical protein
MGKFQVFPSYTPFGGLKSGHVYFIYLIRNEGKCPYFGILKTIFKDQILCQNVKIKMFDLSLIIINKVMNEHLAYQKITFDIIVNAQLMIESKSNL